MNINQWAKKLFYVLCVVVLCAGCSSGGASSGQSNGGSAILSMAAANEYPAGIAFTAYFTITNTSQNNANDLIYSVESNFTGKQIIVDPNGAGQGCANIPAGSSCVFTADIPAGSSTGSFTVSARPNISIVNKYVDKLIGSDLFAVESQRIFSATTTLVHVPATDTPFYILPSEQTLVNQTLESSIVYVSVLVRSSANLFNNLVLMDESGNFLNYYLLNPQLGTASNAVNTYKVVIPAGESMQSIQVLSALNNIATCVNNCSNVSRVHVSSNSIGVLLVEPNNFVMSESYHSQVVVLKNTGTAMITDLQLPTLESGFTISNSTCGNSLSSGASCQFIVDYSVGIYSGINHYEVTYNNGLHDSINMIDISYTGTPAGILTLQPQILTLTPESSVQSIKLINTGNAALTLTSLPILNAPLLQVNTSCQQNQSLLANESCNYTVGYLTAESNGKQLLDFVYNDGKAQNTATSTVNWDTKLTSSRYIFLTSKAYNANLGGFTGANAICQKTAGDMRLAGTFVALLQATSLGINANPNQPIVNLLGQAIFDSGAFTSNAQYHLWSLSSNNSANICVQGDLMCQNTKFFWSGVTPQASAITPYDGWTNYPNTAEQNSCNNWTSASPLYNGVYGNTWKTDAPVNIGNPDENQSLWVWLNQTCDNTLSLLCIQQ